VARRTNGGGLLRSSKCEGPRRATRWTDYRRAVIRSIQLIGSMTRSVTTRIEGLRSLLTSRSAVRFATAVDSPVRQTTEVEFRSTLASNCLRQVLNFVLCRIHEQFSLNREAPARRGNSGVKNPRKAGVKRQVHRWRRGVRVAARGRRWTSTCRCKRAWTRCSHAISAL
jgi:hypothetical protein